MEESKSAAHMSMSALLALAGKSLPRLMRVKGLDQRRYPRGLQAHLYPGEYRTVTNWSPRAHAHMEGKNRSEKRRNAKVARRKGLEAKWNSTTR